MGNNRIEADVRRETLDVSPELTPHDKRLTSARADILTTWQVSRELKCSTQHVTNLCGRGKIPAFKIGGHWRVTREELSRFEGRKAQADRRKSLLTVSEVADTLCYCIDTVVRLCRKGKIPAEKIGRDWYVEPKVLKRLIEGKGGGG